VKVNEDHVLKKLGRNDGLVLLNKDVDDLEARLRLNDPGSLILRTGSQFERLSISNFFKK
jgi:hypothetical protein